MLPGRQRCSCVFVCDPCPALARNNRSHCILRYKILCGYLLKPTMNAKESSKIIMESTGIDAEQYRLGSTKVQTWFPAL